MKRKDFFKGTAAVLGSLAMARSLKPAELGRWIQTAAGDDEDYFWKLVRDQFILDPDWTYLNFGGLGSSPLPVLKCYDEWSRSEERAPSAGHDETQWMSVKEKLAAVLGKACRKEDLGLIDCATSGINMIVNGLPLKKGDEVITSTHEYVALHTGLLNRIWKHNHALAERFYAGLKDLPDVEIMSPDEEIYRTAMISFKMKGIDYPKVNEHLAKDKIKVRTVTEGGCNGIRVSFHICNHDAEVAKILDSLKALKA
jgi:selenocysteine lyase/cysteine desulfurase